MGASAPGGLTVASRIERLSHRFGILGHVIVAVDQTTWDLWGQIGVWFLLFPAFIGILATYIFFLVTAERRQNQSLNGRWGTAAKNKRDGE